MPVRALSVVVSGARLHTGHMAVYAGATSFVTGASGFIGNELIKVLVARGHQVFGLAQSVAAAQHVRQAGAVAVMGDLLEPGQWQDGVAAEWVFHLPPHPFDGTRLTRRWAASVTRARVLMDAHLLDAVVTSTARRIVYVADTSFYGATGPRPITEDEPPRPSAWGRCFAPALDRVDGYLAAGLPIVTAFPGWVYGNASWFRTRIIEPVRDGRRVLQFGKDGPWVSPIHVHDCARALVHLAEHGEDGGRFSRESRSGSHVRVRGDVRRSRPLRATCLARPGGCDPAHRRSRSRRPFSDRRRVLEHSPTRNRLPLPVSDAGGGTPASPRSAP